MNKRMRKKQMKHIAERAAEWKRRFPRKVASITELFGVLEHTPDFLVNGIAGKPSIACVDGSDPRYKRERAETLRCLRDVARARAAWLLKPSKRTRDRAFHPYRVPDVMSPSALDAAFARGVRGW